MTNQTVEKQTIPFAKLLPNFKKFLPKKSNKYYDKVKDIHNNGEYLEATDSHVLIRAKQDLVTDHNICVYSESKLLWEWEVFQNEKV